MNLVYYPNKLLDKKLEDVNIENPGFDPKELKEQMTSVMLDNNGIGLTASQVGLDYNLFVMGDSKENATIHINPTVLEYTEDTVLELEGCLSFPNVFVKVKRPKEILGLKRGSQREQRIGRISQRDMTMFISRPLLGQRCGNSKSRCFE